MDRYAALTQETVPQETPAGKRGFQFGGIRPSAMQGAARVLMFHGPLNGSNNLRREHETT